MNFIIRIIVTSLLAYALANILPGVHVDDFLTAVVFAVVLAILNAIVKPILIILTLPLTLITLGLFLFVVNTLVVLLASKFVDGFSINGFWWGLLFSLILSVLSSLLIKAEKKPED